VYRRGFAKVAEPALKRGQNAIYPLLEDGSWLEDGVDRARAGVQEIGVLAIDEKELVAAGFGAWMFRNINTIRDLESCAKQSREPAGSTVLSSKGLHSE
jgi:molybdopterin-guanine dinucleotide biosynthesis protein A